MAAIQAVANGARVLICEKNRRIGRKLAITGKGRCNVTNNCPTAELLKNVTGGHKFLYSAFSRFTAQDTMRFFESLGVELKTERGNRVFPTSDKADDIVSALERYLLDLGVEIRTGTVTEICAFNQSSFRRTDKSPPRFAPAACRNGDIYYKANEESGWRTSQQIQGIPRTRADSRPA